MHARLLPITFVTLAPLAGCFDAPPDGPPLETCTDTTWRSIEAIDLGVLVADVRRLGRDLDGDGATDNQLGAAVTTMQQQYPDVDLAGRFADRLGAALPWQLWTAGCAEGAGRYADLVLDAAISTAPTWIAADGAVTAGATPLPLAWMGDPIGDAPTPGWLTLRHAHVVPAPPGPDGAVTISVTGALDAAAVSAVLARPWARYLSARLAAGTSAWAAEIDARGDGDGVVSEAELQAHSLWSAMLGPDLGDGDVSFGFELTARP